MSKNLHVIGGSVLGALALMAVSVMPASAAPATGTEGGAGVVTTATVEVEGGALTFATDTAGLSLGKVASGISASSVTGNLPAVTVSDLRGSTAGWDVSAASTPFTLGDQESTSVMYDAAVSGTTGTVTLDAADAVNITAAAPVVTTATTSGNNTASWIPSLTVNLPASALAGVYEGTVTTSVV